MKITNTKTLALALLLLGATVLMQPSAQAEMTVGEILGTAWTIGNEIVGETTLYPAYAINRWYQRSVISTPYQFGNLDVTYQVNRDRLGMYFYHTKIVRDQADPFPNPRTSTNAFPVNSMNKLNMTCYSYTTNSDSTVNVTTNITVQTASEVVWLDHVVKTGLWPDDGPWTVWLKTGGNHTSCSGPTPTKNYYFWVPASVSQGGGYVTVSLGTANCILNYPFYLTSNPLIQ